MFLISLISANEHHRQAPGSLLNENTGEETQAAKWLLIEKTLCQICIDYLHLFDQAVCVGKAELVNSCSRTQPAPSACNAT